MEYMTLEEKEQRLEDLLRSLAPVVIAFSGGVDSTYLAYKAHTVLGGRALAVTAESPSVPSHQRRMAADIVRQTGIAHKVIYSQELERAEYINNPFDRCFYCKDELFTKLGAIAREFGSATLLDGLNADDLDDFRPGRKAAQRHKVRSPLMEAGLSKEEIRELSRRAGLPTADLPASACLASRIPYGVQITAENLKIVDEGEEALRRMGFRIFRVRHHEQLARLEFGREDLRKALNPEMASRLVPIFKKLGYKFVTLDLEGYRTGSANEVLTAGETEKFQA
ncbi:MAG: ATP-dependent sacrificial sulfur transferase LarE [Acidobacteria bacterium]|nr:ATP-dependent sacrificial sulfur transferase LarE [Acidobacteriota bacterium]